MNTKQYVLDVLNIIKGKRFPAFGWIYMIEQGYADADLLQTLYDVLKHALQRTQDTSLQDTFKKSLHILEHLKELEQASQDDDEKDLSDLETMIETL